MSSGTRRSWYGFSTRLADDFALPDNVGCVFAQWHDQAKLGDPSGKPPIAIRYRAGRLFVTGAYGRVASPEPDIRYEFASVADFPPASGMMSSSASSGRGTACPRSRCG